MKVAVCGWYGHGNLGDELILEGLHNIFKDSTLQIYSNDSSGKYPPLNFKAINKCSLFVLGGGELIRSTCLFMRTPSIFNLKEPSLANSLWWRTPFSKRSWIHKIKVPKAVLGCGVNAKAAFELSHWVVDGLNQFDYIGLRDQTAVQILKRFPQLYNKVHLTYDLSFQADTLGYHWKPTRNQALVIATDRFSKGDRGVQEIGIAEKSKPWLTKKLAPFEKAVFIPFGSVDNDDYRTAETLASCHRNSEILKPHQVTKEKTLALISESALTIPYRLHGLILAFMLNAKYCFIPYHWKLNRVYETLKGKMFSQVKLEQEKTLEKLRGLPSPFNVK